MIDPDTRLDERLLLMRCQLGDQEAYRELVESYGPRLTYYLRKLLGKVDKADDLAQEVWLDVLRQLPRLKEIGAFRTWLYRIAHGKAMQDFRRNGRTFAAIVDFEQLIEHDEMPIQQEDVEQIHQALDQLEPIYREVLVLRFLEDLSYEEIGRIADCPIGTVRSRLHYAKAQLRRAFIANSNPQAAYQLEKGKQP